MADTPMTVGTQLRGLLRDSSLATNERKLRLLASACCRRAWRLLISERSRRAVALAERRADGLVELARLQEAYIQACKAVSPQRWPAQRAAAAMAAAAADPRITRRGQLVAYIQARVELAQVEPFHDAFRALVADVFGPGKVRVPAPWWRTPLVLDIARRVREERDVLAMFVLGDALEDAGCDDERLLEHCRSGAGHVRGCWAVDLLLGLG
jgi:hypothetical protein